jgi:hypothetical protein
MGWERVCAVSREGGQEGNMVLVGGKVRVRDEQVQLNCNSVRLYEAGEVSESQTHAELEQAPEARETIPVKSKRRVVVKLTQTDDKASDLSLLSDTVEILKRFPGGDEVWLSVVKGEETSILKLPSLRVDYSSDLIDNLTGLLGEECIEVTE